MEGRKERGREVRQGGRDGEMSSRSEGRRGGRRERGQEGKGREGREGGICSPSMTSCGSEYTQVWARGGDTHPLPCASNMSPARGRSPHLEGEKQKSLHYFPGNNSFRLSIDGFLYILFEATCELYESNILVYP